VNTKLEPAPETSAPAERLEDVINELSDRWLSTLDLSPDTVDTYRQSLKTFLEWITEQKDTQVTAGTVRDFRDALNDDYAATTVNLRLSALRSFFDWAVRQDHLPANPAESVQSLRTRSSTRRHKREELSSEEVAGLLETCEGDRDVDKRNRAIVALMAFTGVRTVELHRANIEDLETKNDRMILWVQGKGQQDKSDFVVLPDPAVDAVREWLKVHPDGDDQDPLFVSLSNRNRGARITRHAIRTMIKRNMEDAGIVGDNKTTHSLRHSAISNAIRNGADPQQAQSMARHANVNTTMIYYHEIGRTEDPAEDRISYEKVG
jgi:integrase/recombinase XerD